MLACAYVHVPVAMKWPVSPVAYSNKEPLKGDLYMNSFKAHKQLAKNKLTACVTVENKHQPFLVGA